jgi:hypothetical protein
MDYLLEVLIHDPHNALLICVCQSYSLDLRYILSEVHGLVSLSA